MGGSMELAPDISPDDIELFLQEADEQLQLLDEDFVKLEHEADSAELLQEISRYARILAITDAYFDLVSSHGGHKALAPNQAAEYIMAYSGELFDPALVQVFMAEVPLYPNGVTVRLSTGEIGIVADVNIGYVGRPIVRVVTDERGRNIRTPYDMNLADQENQGRLIVQVMDY